MNDLHSSVKLGENVVLRNFIYIGEETCIGDGTRVANFCNFDKRCIIGRNCNFQAHVTLNDDTHVGDNVFMSLYSCTIDEVYPTVGAQYRKPISIGSNVVIGAHAVIGASVGMNSVVAAGSVITRPVPQNVVVRGKGNWEVMGSRADYDRKHLQEAMEVEWR